MNTKHFTFFFICLLLCLFFAAGVPAQTVSLSPATVSSPSQGQQFTVSLTIEGGRNVSGYQATVVFDSSALKYVKSSQGSYLPAGAFVVPAKATATTVTLASAGASSASSSDGTLATLTFEVRSVKASTLTLSGVTLSDTAAKITTPATKGAKIVPAIGSGPDVNGDCVVNIGDLVLVAASLGETGSHASDVNGDQMVNIGDLVLVANALGTNPCEVKHTELPPGMVSIPAGEFQMGSNDGENDEQPVHTVSVDAFFMDEHETTNLEYKKFVLANPRWGKDRIDGRFHNGRYLHHWNGNNYPNGKANHPVDVSWYAAMAYAGWVGKRLPTEAEWEYAARGGLVGKKYPWGDVIDSGRANYSEGGSKDTTAVGKYPPNGYGLYDMAGNVWEWCLDEYNKDFYFSSPRENPLSGANTVDWIISNFTGVNPDTRRVIRSGSWSTLPGTTNVRVANRSWAGVQHTDGGIGFRCVRDQ